MGEFKDGALKSGGSGRKVTNPKQAIAIALSEAEGMNQGGIVGLAQMGSPFTNSIRPQRQTTMGPRSIAPMQQRGFQGPQQMGPIQRNFMQMQNQMRGMQQNPLELYQNYLGQKYIGPMQQEQQDKISKFVGAVNQAERQAFGEQQGGARPFDGPPINIGAPGGQTLLQEPAQRTPSFSLTYNPLQLDVPRTQGPAPMNQAPAVMPGGYSDRAARLETVVQYKNQGGMMYSDIMNRPMFQTPQQRQGLGIMAGVAPVRGYADGGEAEEIAVTAESPEELDIKLFGEGGVLFDTDSPISSTLMALTIPIGGGLIGLTARGLMAARKAAQVAGKIKPRVRVSGAGGKPRVKASDMQPTPPPPPSIAARAAGIPAAVAGAIKRNPGRTALAGIAAGGASQIPFGGGTTTDEPPADTSTDDTGGGDDTGDQQSGIMKFLFGSDGIGGEPGAVGKTMDYLADPKTRYALARAAESRPGVVDRNVFTDFTLGQAEYEAAQQQNQTAFMKNFEALREIYPDDVSDEEVAKLALGDSDDPRKTFLSLFEAKVGSMIPPTEADIKNFAALSGFELSDAQIKQLVSSVKPSDTVS